MSTRLVDMSWLVSKFHQLKYYFNFKVTSALTVDFSIDDFIYILVAKAFELLRQS